MLRKLSNRQKKRKLFLDHTNAPLVRFRSRRECLTKKINERHRLTAFWYLTLFFHQLFQINKTPRNIFSSTRIAAEVVSPGQLGMLKDARLFTAIENKKFPEHCRVFIIGYSNLPLFSDDGWQVDSMSLFVAVYYCAITANCTYVK